MSNSSNKHYEVLAFCYNATKTDLETARRILDAMDLSTARVWDLRFFRFDASGYQGPDDPRPIVAFGQRAELQISKSLPDIPRHLTILPELHLLDKRAADPKARKDTHEALSKLISAFDEPILALPSRQPQPIRLTEDVLQLVDLSKLPEVEKSLRDKGLSCWEGVTANGKRIRLSIEQEVSPRETDIALTFREFTYLAVAMRLLGLQEVTVVPGHIPIAEHPSSQPNHPVSTSSAPSSSEERDEIPGQGTRGRSPEDQEE